jgi:capsular polysaccharide biosynthesis protein
MLRRRLGSLPDGRPLIFLSRGSSGARRILKNEPEVRARLERSGYITIDVEKASAEEILAACKGASVVVSVEGSHLAPLLYLMRDHGTMVILNPPYQVQTTVATVALFCRILPGMFVCQPDGESRTDFIADLDELMRFIDDAVEATAARRGTLDEFVDRVLRLARNSTPDIADWLAADA